MKLAVLAAVVLAATFVCAGCATHVAQRGIDYHLMEVSGSEAINCGKIQFPPAMRHLLDAEQATQISRCIESARASRRAFFFSVVGRVAFR